MTRCWSACAAKKVACSSARAPSDGHRAARESIASAAVAYSAAVVMGMSMPWRSSAIEAIIESISGLAVTRHCVSASSGKLRR
eukprot:6030438-Prymnesium_polylepis.1